MIDLIVKVVIDCWIVEIIILVVEDMGFEIVCICLMSGKELMF